MRAKRESNRKKNKNQKLEKVVRNRKNEKKNGKNDCRIKKSVYLWCSKDEGKREVASIGHGTLTHTSSQRQASLVVRVFCCSVSIRFFYFSCLFCTFPFPIPLLLDVL